ncbi:hypothetical protein OROHE_021399 [Orobanche hederae]
MSAEEGGAGAAATEDNRSVFSRLGPIKAYHRKIKVYVSNFPSHLSKSELWKICDKIAKVEEVFIASKLSKWGVPFGFVQFLISGTEEAIVKKLSSIRIGNLKLSANVAKFDKKASRRFSVRSGAVEKYAKVLAPPFRERVVPGSSYADVLRGKSPVPAASIDPVIVLDGFSGPDFPFGVIASVKKFDPLPNLYSICLSEGFGDLDIKYLGGLWVLFNFDSAEAKEKFLSHEGIQSWFVSLLPWTRGFLVEDRLARLEIEGLPLDVWSDEVFGLIVKKWGVLQFMGDTERNNLYSRQVCVKTSVSKNIFDSLSVKLGDKMSSVRVREIIGWVPEFVKEEIRSGKSSSSPVAHAMEVSSKEFVDECHGEDNYVEEVHVVDDSSHEVPSVGNEPNVQGDVVREDSDPLDLLGLIVKTSSKKDLLVDEAPPSDVTPEFPPGFPRPLCPSDGSSGGDQVRFSSDKLPCPINSSVILELEKTIDVGKSLGIDVSGCLGNRDNRKWIRDLCVSNGVSFLGLQETKLTKLDLFMIRAIWGTKSFEFASSSARGRSGGLLCIWDPCMFAKSRSYSTDNYVVVEGSWLPLKSPLMFINVYPPQDGDLKIALWSRLFSIIGRWNGPCVVFGDFNVVRDEGERFGSVFNSLDATFFNDFIMEADLIDPPLRGFSFTWVHSSGSKMSKLDRFLISNAFLDLYPDITGTVLTKKWSDHRPVLLKEFKVDYGPIPFKTFHSWFRLEGFDKVVEDGWRSQSGLVGNPMEVLKKKFQYLKSLLRDWVANSRSTSLEALSNLEGELFDFDKKIDEGNSDPELLCNRSKCLSEIGEIEHVFSLDVAQKAKIKWAIEGDENSKFFHSFLKRKRKHDSIRGVMVNGSWITSPDAVKEAFRNHFCQRFSAPFVVRPRLEFHASHILTSSQYDRIEDDFSYSEIKQAVWDCGSDKSPSPDGFSFGFVKKFWHILEVDICKAIIHFSFVGDFPLGCNASFIALIPKVCDATTVQNFRPISLVGLQYKIIGKLLANRLTGVIGSLVGLEQSAFIKGRQILDGPLILEEIINWYKDQEKRLLVFKVDFEKAYDSLSWEFLDEMFIKMGFPDRWRGWIRGCLVSTRVSVLVNGSPTSEFYCSRGLRQGDPLSPFLFIIAMEGLNILMKNAVSLNLFQGAKVGRDELPISHLFYADDAIFLGDWSRSNVSTLLRLLRCFFLASGLKINLSKCNLVGIGVDNSYCESLANSIGCSVLRLPMVYLGLHIVSNMYRIDSWNHVVDRVKARLNNWKANMLSIGGRLSLIKSVLGSVAIYPLSIFKLPIAVAKSIEAIRRNFFIGKSSDSRKMSWFAWDHVLTSKENGGLGIGSLFALNRALLFKWWWRFMIDPSALWVKVIKSLYGVDGGIGSSRLKNSTWSNILKSVRVLKDKGLDIPSFCSRKVGNGLSTRFWEDIWCGNGPLKLKFPRIYLLDHDKSAFVHQRVNPEIWVSVLRHPPRGGRELTQFQELLSILALVVLSDGHDRWVWQLDNSGVFSVASLRRVIDDHQLLVGNSPTTWNSAVPLKVNVFSWRLENNKLPTRDCLVSRGLEIDSTNCVLCSSGQESVDHLFFSCPIVSAVWGLLFRWWKIQGSSFSNSRDWSAWLLTLRLKSKSRRILEAVCLVLFGRFGD